MKRLIMQTYIKDTIDRGTINTYKAFPKLERHSKRCFTKYAQINNIDYVFITSSDRPNYNSAHWLRMEMFHQPDYDEVLYVDCDVLINKTRMKDNIFDVEGSFVPKIWAFPHCNAVPGVYYPEHPSGEFNAGVTKWTREECKIMRDHIHEFYHPTHNQVSLNQCYKKYVGDYKKLPYRFNVTHRPTNDITFRHYPGMQKLKMSQCPIWKTI